MGIGGLWQWVVVLIVILLLFGTKRLRNLGSDLGHAVKGFRKGMQSETEKIAEVQDVTEEPAAEKDKAAEAAQTKDNSAPASEK